MTSTSLPADQKSAEEIAQIKARHDAGEWQNFKDGSGMVWNGLTYLGDFGEAGMRIVIAEIESGDAVSFYDTELDATRDDVPVRVQLQVPA